MKHKGILLLFVVGILFCTTASSASDDVYVDLSVLDSLDVSNSPRINNQPLFPIVAKKQAVKPVKRKVAKKVQAKKPEVKDIKPDSKVEIVANKVEEKTIPENVKGVEQVKETIPTINEVVVEKKEEALPQPAQVDVIASSDELTKVQESTENSILPKEESAPKALLIQNEIKENEPVTSVEIRFEGEDNTLTDIQKSNLDELVNGLGTNTTARLGIYAFNYEDGQDAFKKKRESLNRALEVRSYLMDKGFRTFSVKVINVNDDSSKKNLIIVEEVK